MVPKVSVIIAAYNVERFISKCVDSVLAQTFSDYEIILIDDGSTDQTPEICDRLAKKSKKITVIHQPNQGLSEVRNRGIRNSTGEYIALIDGDDYVSVDFLEKLMDAITKNKAEIAGCGFKTVPVRRLYPAKSGVFSGEQATIDLLTEQETYQIVSWNKIYKRELFKGIEFPVRKRNEDCLTTYKLLGCAKKVAYVDELLYYYSQRDDSIMGTIELKERLDMKLLAATEAKEYFKGNRKLEQAAEICELLAYFSYIDNICAGRLNLSLKRYFDFIKERKDYLLANPYINNKLETYIKMVTFKNGGLYKAFRKIKN
ncbi:glycosyltransferase [Candidatus Saccharibacteria bacterium]|nr:glycosyltransferase [Candidatus Saccharibacteria bacterium]